MPLDELFPHVMEYQPEVTADTLLPKGGGVYLLTDADDRVIQLAAAADLHRALCGRLASPGHARGYIETSGEASATPSIPSRKRANLGQIVRRIRWSPADSMFELTYAYYRIARILLPDYLKQVAFGPAWFVHVDPSAALPRFVVGKLLRSSPGIDLGPFAMQQDATRFVEILEDAFDLCRYYHILEQAPHGQACAYFEMGKCPAPCDGSIPISDYGRMIGSALAFALGEREQFYAGQEQQMRTAAAAMAFERAGLFKQQLDRARGIEHACYRFVRPIDDFNYLVVQRGGGRTRVKPFFVRHGVICVGDTVKLKELDTVATEWLMQMRQTQISQPNISAEERSEHIWLVSQFLFKPASPGVFIHADALPEQHLFADQLRTVFTAKCGPTIEQS